MQVKYEKNATIMVARWLNVFALLYFAQFFIGCSQFIVASAVASWYFTHNKKNLDSPLIRGYTFLIRYHLGTVAFGSFIIAFVKFARLLLKIVQVLKHNYLIKSSINYIFLYLIEHRQQPHQPSHDFPVSSLSVLPFMLREIPAILESKRLHHLSHVRL